MSDNIKELKLEADQLGVKYSPNIGEVKLQEKIDAAYAAEETSGAKLVEAVKAEEAKEEEAPKKNKGWGPAERRALAKKREADAKKTKVITIIDNDQRVNNQTTTCTVNCSNEHFDLGQIILPLNMEVEVMQGHINSLKGVEIVNHVKDPVTKMSTYVQRPRYTISYSDNQPK